MTGIAEWLTAIWDEQEEEAREALDLSSWVTEQDGLTIEWRWVRMLRHADRGGAASTSYCPGALSPADQLARVASDREILADLGMYCFDTPGHPCGTCERVGCRTLRRMASAYATRPGYLPEWSL